MLIAADVPLGWTIGLAVFTALAGTGGGLWLQRQSQRNAELVRREEQERADRARREEEERADRAKRAEEAREARVAARALDAELRDMEGALEAVEREAVKVVSSSAESGRVRAPGSKEEYWAYLELHAAMVSADRVVKDDDWKARRDTLSRYLGSSEQWERLEDAYAGVRFWDRTNAEPVPPGDEVTMALA